MTVLYERRTPILVDESNKIRQLIQTWDMMMVMVPNLTLFILNIPNL